jgi:hypothetical protein
MSHAPEKPTVLSVEASPEQQAQPARCALAAGYALLLATLRDVARKHGYALAVHGTMMRDLDLIAAPWTEEATDDETLARALCAAIGGKIYGAMHDGKTDKVDYNPVQRPHGRKGWVIHIGGGPYLDVAVMPRLSQHNKAI